MKTISVSILHDKYKVIGSIARKIIRHLEAAGKVRKYASGHATQYHYAGVEYAKEDPKAETGKGAKGAKAAAPKKN